MKEPGEWSLEGEPLPQKRDKMSPMIFHIKRQLIFICVHHLIIIRIPSIFKMEYFYPISKRIHGIPIGCATTKETNCGNNQDYDMGIDKKSLQRDVRTVLSMHPESKILS